MWIRQSLNFIADQIVPRSCVFCGTSSEGAEDSICVGCLADLPFIESGYPSVAEPFEYLIAPLSYEFPVDVAIKALKFKRRLFYASAFAEILCSVCDQLPGDIDAVLPVPLHWRREAFRGFNQAVEIAKPVAKHLGVPMIRSVRRKIATPYQSGLAAKERASNLRQAFEVRKALSQTHALIVDDVITTASTVSSLAKLVLANGVQRVNVLAIARA